MRRKWKSSLILSFQNGVALAFANFLPSTPYSIVRSLCDTIKFSHTNLYNRIRNSTLSICKNCKLPSLSLRTINFTFRQRHRNCPFSPRRKNSPSHYYIVHRKNFSRRNRRTADAYTDRLVERRKKKNYTR